MVSSALQDVLRAPASVEARRELAAKLRADGDPHAELAELQVADRDGLPLDREYELLERIDQLVTRPGRAWAGPIADRVKRYSYELGLVSGMTVTGQTFVDHGMEATKNLIQRIYNKKLDLEWLLGTKLTDPELTQLALADNTPWDQYKAIAAATAKGEEPSERMLLSAHAHFRGAAAEMVAMEEKNLPKGFKYKEKLTGDGTVTDHELIGRDGKPAELEVKGLRGENWPSILREALRDGGEVDESLARLIRQVKGAAARGNPVYVAVSDSLSGPSLARLKQFFIKENVVVREVILLPENEIIAAGEALRTHLGIPQPKPPGPETRKPR